ncbi:hypothetical protein [Salipiger bermudensis]|uniref:hypothetical protein n=1 Tax=Salipiger bermudensis TaxID=344736 RepID=UPI00351968BF
MAYSQDTTRRALLKGLPAAGAAVFLPHVAQGGCPDPVVEAYQEWLGAREEWRELSELPGNENFDHPRMLELDDIEIDAETRMLEQRPTSLEGVAALAALAFMHGLGGFISEEQLALEEDCWDCKIAGSIWRACTGQEGLPPI